MQEGYAPALHARPSSIFAKSSRPGSECPACAVVRPVSGGHLRRAASYFNHSANLSDFECARVRRTCGARTDAIGCLDVPWRASTNQPPVAVPEHAPVPLCAPQMGEHLAAVKAYITKFDLERELSNAVNLAIKEDAPDPYRVIIDYLKDLTQVRSMQPAGRLFLVG